MGASRARRKHGAVTSAIDASAPECSFYAIDRRGRATLLRARGATTEAQMPTDLSGFAAVMDWLKREHPELWLVGEREGPPSQKEKEDQSSSAGSVSGAGTEDPDA